MNDTKMDIQRSGETIERTAVKYSAKATKGLAKLTKMLTLYGIKMFANPLNAIKKDGPNKTLIHTPELTKEEAKVMIAKLREAEILATYREVEPSGREIRRGISIHNQEKMAKNDIKLAQWKDRAVKYERFSLLGKFCESQADKYQNLVNQENRMPAENKYIFIVNQRHSNALNEMLADIREMRLTKDFDNSVFEKEMDENLVPELKMEDMELTVESMEEGIEFKLLNNPVEILGYNNPDDKRDPKNGFVTGMKCIRMELGEPDEKGRRRPVPVPGSEFVLDVNTVIIAIGTSPNPLIKSTTKGLEVNKKGGIVVEEGTGLTSREGVYAGGDAVTGAATVISAMGAGKAAAKAIDEYLSNK